MHLLPLILIVAGIAAYSNSLSAPFIFDDFDAIKNNATIRKLWPISEAAWARQDSPLAGRPVVNYSFALNYALAGGTKDTRPYHITNLILHLAAALALFGVIRRTLVLWRPAEFNTTAPLFALTASLLWLLHPLQTEAVTYLTQRTELLMSLFFLLTLYCSTHIATVPETESAAQANRNALQKRFPATILWTTLAILFCALGMASKEVMAVAPLIVFIHDATFLSKSWRNAARRWPLYLGLGATWLILAAILHSAPRSQTVGLGHERVNPVEYLLTQSGVIVHYLRLAVWPTALCIDYNDWPIAKTIATVWPQFVILTILTIVTLIGVIRRAAWGFLGAWVLIILAPTSSVVPILSEVAAERRMYLPLAGLTVAAAWVVWQGVIWIVLRAKPRPATGPFLATVLLVALAAPLGSLTYRRNALYGDEIALWKDAVAQRPANDRALHGLGNAYFERGKMKGDALLLEQARANIEAALRVNPSYENAHVGLGNVYMAMRKPADAEPHLRFAADANPNIPERQFFLGYSLALQNRPADALGPLQAAARLDPKHYRARFLLAQSLLLLNRPADAIPPLQELLAIPFDEPDTALRAWKLLAHAHLALGHNADARSALQRALQLAPADAESRALLEQIPP